MTYWLIRGEWEIPDGLPEGCKGRTNFAMEFNDYLDRCAAAGKEKFPYNIFAAESTEARWEHYGVHETAETFAYNKDMMAKYGDSPWRT